MPALEFLEQWCLPAIRSNQEVWISFYPYHIFNDLARYKVAFMTQQPHQFKEHFVSFQMYTLIYNRIIYCSNIIYKNIFGFTIIVPGVIVFSSVLKKSSITIYCYCGSFKTNFSKSVIIQQCKKQLHSQISNNFFYWQRHCCF